MFAPGQAARAGELDGWQGMRIIKQEGSPSRLVVADLAGDGRQQLIAINTRLSRLDIYRWLPAAEQKPPSAADADRPNELPGSPDWKRTELDLDELPADVLARDLDGDGKAELVILTSPSNKVLLYKQTAPDEWKKTTQWDLLPGPTSGRHELLLTRERPAGGLELFVSCEQGIQTLVLAPGSRPTWLSPRERRGRLEWRFVDLDGDGDQDLVEWSQQPKQTIRWYESRDGKLMSAQVLYDQAATGARAMPVLGGPAELLLLGGAQEGLLRRYILGRGEENDLGRQESLPMPGGPKALWTGILLSGRPALAAVDTGQPRLRIQPVGDDGWQAEETFPLISNVRGLAAVHAQPGKLLLWVKDATDLYTSVWENNRITYPTAMPQSADVADRTILALGTVGTTTWWVQRVGSDLDLYVWDTKQMEPERTRFAGSGGDAKAKAEKVMWIGGKRLLVQLAYSNAIKLVTADEAGKVTTREPANLVKVDMTEFAIYNVGGRNRLGRLTDGVLQWLNDDLQPTDQVMLPDGQRIASFVPLADGTAWALEQGGAFVHRMKPDEAGILRVERTQKPPGGSQLLLDPILGLMLVDQERVVRLGRGRPWELALRDSFDGRVGRPSGVKEATIHRITTTDVTGDGQEEVILFDDVRHQVTVLGRTDKELSPLGSWKVFDDRTYPYGGKEEQQIAEPRAVVGFDADGDHCQDMALLSQDRLIIYLAREPK
ncbi:MAG: hypothetical protein HYX69_03010 [Planctomycetia bacterium]|nr:hypothetical protein [Planctomycetia bacterium]